MHLPAALLLAPLVVVAQATEAEAPRRLKVAITEVSAGFGVEEGRVKVIAELIQDQLANELGHEVIGRADIEAMLGLERMKDLLACGEESSCMAQIGGALGVDEMVTGSLARLGSYLVLTLKRISPRDSKVVGQGTRKLKGAGDDEVIEAIGPLVREIYGVSSSAAASTPATISPTSPSSAAAPPPNLVLMSEDGETYEVIVEQGDAVYRCDRPISPDAPCNLVVPAGMAKLVVRDRFEESLEIWPAPTQYHLDHRSRLPWLLVGGIGGGLGAAGVVFFHVKRPDDCLHPQGFGTASSSFEERKRLCYKQQDSDERMRAISAGVAGVSIVVGVVGALLGGNRSFTDSAPVPSLSMAIVPGGAQASATWNLPADAPQ